MAEKKEKEEKVEKPKKPKKVKEDVQADVEVTAPMPEIKGEAEVPVDETPVEETPEVEDTPQQKYEKFRASKAWIYKGQRLIPEMEHMAPVEVIIAVKAKLGIK
jgi:hypothetical protein